MSLAVVLSRHGGPDALEIAERELASPRNGEIRVKHTAIGVNYHDIYVRQGSSGSLALPGVPGIEAAGIVVARGEGVEGVSIGERIAYVTPTYGCYAQEANVPAAYAMPLPSILSEASAASTMLKALTARMLLEECYRVRSGQTVLVHAASGGVGQFLCQWAKAIGATVVGTVSTPGRSEPARRAGADHVIARSEGSFVDAVRELTGGLGVSAVYDAIGAETIEASLACLAYGGALINYGEASGVPGPISLNTLGERSLSVSRPRIFHFLRTDEQRQEAQRAVFGALEAGWLRPMDPLVFPLREAALAHETLENRGGPGGIVLQP